VSDKPSYTPKNPEGLMALGLLSQVKETGTAIGNLDVASLRPVSRAETLYAIGKMARYLLEAELIRPATDGTLPVLLSLRKMLGELNEMAGVLERECKQTPFLRALEEWPSVTKVSYLTTSNFMEEGLSVCIHMGEHLSVPLEWDPQTETLHAVVALTEGHEDLVGVLDLPDVQELVTSLASQFPDMFVIDPLPPKNLLTGDHLPGEITFPKILN